MGFASTDRVELRQVKETVAGTTPASPTLKEVRWTSESLNYGLQNVVSNEIRSDRMTSDLIKTQSSAAGDIGIELSFLDHEDFLIAALGANAFATPFNVSSATDISATASTKQFESTSTDITTNLAVGQWIKVSGFTDSTNNGYFRVTALSGTDTITVAQTLADEAAGDTIGMSGTMIKNGTDLDSFTLQKFLADADTPTYFNMTGASVNTMNLNFTIGQPLAGSFGFLGFGVASATSQISGATESDAVGNEIMNSVDNVSSVQIDDVVTTSCLNAMSITLNNNLRQQFCIGSLAASGIGSGKIDLSGNIDIYFKDSTMYDKYVNSTAFSLSWRVTDVSGNTYIFTLPRVKFETGDLSASGSNTDMMFSGTWRGIRDTDSNAMIQIDKFAV